MIWLWFPSTSENLYDKKHIYQLIYYSSFTRSVKRFGLFSHNIPQTSPVPRVGGVIPINN